MKKKIFFISISFIFLLILCFMYQNSYAVSYNYKFNSDSKVIYRIEPNTNVSEFLAVASSRIAANSSDVVKLYQASNNGYEEVTSGKVKTNMIVAKNATISDNGNGFYSIQADNPIYKTAVIGDLNGDGIYNQIDLSILIRHAIGLTAYQITDTAILKAADVNDDFVVNQTDVTNSINYIVAGTMPENTTRQDYTMILSESSGTTTYGTNKTFSITNPTGGAVSVSSSDESVATASVSGSTITITPKKSGSAIITVSSEETAQYTAGSASYVIVVNKATGNVALSSYSGIVEAGQTINFNVSGNHGNTVSVRTDNANVVNANINNGTVTVTGVGPGTATITVTAAEDERYTQASAEYTVRCKRTTYYVSNGKAYNRFRDESCWGYSRCGTIF